MSRRLAVPLALAACLTVPAAAPAATPPPTFDTAVRLPFGLSAAHVAIGDLDGDGRPDLVSSAEGTVAVWRATGARSAPYERVADRPAGAGASQLAAGDFDDDGRDDLAVANLPGTVTILLSGAAGPGAAVPVGPSPDGITARDVDGDGDIDLAASSFGSNSISVLTNDGAGSFTPASYDVGCTTTAVAIGDVTGDERADVAALCSVAHRVTVLRREDSGLVQLPGDIPSCSTTDSGRDLATGRFDGDAKDDLVVTCETNRFAVLASSRGLAPLTGPNTSTVPEPYFRVGAAGVHPINVAADDLNGDGVDDVIVPMQGQGGVSHLRVAVGDGAGRFLPQTRGPDGTQWVGVDYPPATNNATGYDVASADLDDDGKPDLVESVGTEVWVWFSTTPRPGVRTGGVRFLGPGASVFEATVNPSGDNPTTYRFQYGTTPAYGESTFSAPTGTSLTGTADQPVSALVQGLTPDTVYHYRVVASNGFGTTYGRDKTFRSGIAPPERTSRPVVTGTRAVGQVLTCAEGGWTGSPTFAFAWLRDGDPIAGAADPQYTATTADAGTALQCEVTARNGGGSTTAVSGPVVIPTPSASGGGTPDGGGGGTPGATTPGGTAPGPDAPSVPDSPSVTAPPAPVFTAPPAIAGAAVVGRTLTCRTGSATQSPRLSVSWRRNGVPIAGATGLSYKVVVRDVRKAIQCRVLAVAAGGATVADSGVVTGRPAPCVVPRLTGLTVGQARTALKAASCRLGKVTRAPSRIRAFRVVASKPGRGKQLTTDSRVAVVISNGRG
jgi:hypothetical protein